MQVQCKLHVHVKFYILSLESKYIEVHNMKYPSQTQVTQQRGQETEKRRENVHECTKCSGQYESYRLLNPILHHFTLRFCSKDPGRLVFLQMMEILTCASSVVEFCSHRKFLQHQLWWGLNSSSTNGLAQRCSVFLTHNSHRLWRNNLNCSKWEVPHLQIKVCPKAVSQHLS